MVLALLLAGDALRGEIGPLAAGWAVLTVTVAGASAWRGWPRGERFAFALGGGGLVVGTIFGLRMDVLALYALLALTVLAGVVMGLRQVVGPLGRRPLRQEERRELRRVLASGLSRAALVVGAAFLLAVLMWASLGLLALGTTSDFTAFALALAAILLLSLLATLPEGTAS